MEKVCSGDLWAHGVWGHLVHGVGWQGESPGTPSQRGAGPVGRQKSVLLRNAGVCDRHKENKPKTP